MAFKLKHQETKKDDDKDTAREGNKSVNSCVLRREPSVEQRARTPESSCQALRKAVSSLNRLDDFDKECIGSGFFSDVFKVTHKVTRQVLVLKMNNNINNRPNMLREVQLMNRLNHPNILKFKGACVHEGVLHALTEYMNGGSLESVLADDDVELDWSVRMRFAVDIARGMRYLHTRGFMHRDLTSKNVLVRKEEEGKMTVVVGDFGLACKIPDPLNENGKALPIVGSPYWMAPECIHCLPYTEKADIFSYGIILCEIIARIEADPDILPRTSNFGLDYVEFSKMAPECPINFLTLTYSCCQYEPKKRPTFGEICDTLEEVKSRSQMAIVLADITNIHVENEDIYDRTILERILIGKGLKRHMSDEAITIKVPDFGDYCSDLEDSDDDESTENGEDDDKFVDASSSPPLSASSQPVKTVIPVTAQFVGEVMSKDDPFYTPRKDNPFTSRFKDASAKLIGSLRDNWAAWFEMPPSPAAPIWTPPGSPLDLDDGSQFVRPIHVRIRRCHSLPGSPSLARKEIDRFQYEHANYSYMHSTKRTVSAMTNIRNMSAMEDSGLTVELDLDVLDARSEDSSSNDSALGSDSRQRRENRRSARALQRNLRDLRKLSMDPYVMGNADKLMFMQRSMESRILDDALQSGRYSYSSSESFTSLEESALLSPTSSYSSYNETDSDFWLSRAQFELFEHRLRSRQRFQELVRNWEAKMMQAENKEGGTSGAEGGSSVARDPRPILLHERLEISDTLDPRFRELRRKWESLLLNTNLDLSKGLNPKLDLKKGVNKGLNPKLDLTKGVPRRTSAAAASVTKMMFEQKRTAESKGSHSSSTTTGASSSTTVTRTKLTLTSTPKQSALKHDKCESV